MLFLFCLSTLSTTPMANMKTSKEVEPAKINGNGKPVGGILPHTTSYCTTINLLNIVLTHSHNLAPFVQDCKANFLFLFFLYILKDFFLL